MVRIPIKIEQNQKFNQKDGKIQSSQKKISDFVLTIVCFLPISDHRPQWKIVEYFREN
jgi:hypothetical protein